MSHTPFYMFHPMVLETSKVIYVTRNPKDVIVSFCNPHKLVKLHDFQGDVELFAKYFMNNESIYTFILIYNRSYIYVRLYTHSYFYSIFQSCFGCLVQKKSSKYVIPVLRRHEKGIILIINKHNGIIYNVICKGL